MKDMPNAPPEKQGQGHHKPCSEKAPHYGTISKAIRDGSKHVVNRICPRCNHHKAWLSVGRGAARCTKCKHQEEEK